MTRHDVRAGERADPTPADVAAFDEVVNATNDLLDQVRTLSAYVAALVSTDAGNDQAATVQSRLQAELAGLQKLTDAFRGLGRPIRSRRPGRRPPPWRPTTPTPSSRPTAPPPIR